jgi:hypothetical protein
MTCRASDGRAEREPSSKPFFVFFAIFVIFVGTLDRCLFYFVEMSLYFVELESPP